MLTVGKRRVLVIVVLLCVAAPAGASTIVVDTAAKTLTFSGPSETGTPVNLFGNGYVQWEQGGADVSKASLNFAGASNFNGTASSGVSSVIRLDFNAANTTLSRISIAQAFMGATGPGTLSFNPVAFSYAGLTATQQATFESTVLGGAFSVPLAAGSSGFNSVFFKSAAIPEPGTFALAALAMGGLYWRSRHKRRRARRRKRSTARRSQV